MLHALQAIIIALVEGVTEFLPISSTGHMILAAKLLHVPDTDFVKSFEIFIQLGAILAVLALYWRKLFLNAQTFFKVCVAFLPTAVIGLTVYKVVKQYLLGNVQVVLWSLLIGGVVLVIFERARRGRETAAPADLTSVTYKQALIIGLFQSIAIVPGVSRSAATIVGGLTLGLSRATIIEFTFLLAIPTMAAATGLDLLKSSHSFSHSEIGILALGFVVAFASALLAVRFLLTYVKTHTFESFGYYRILLALAFFFCLVK